MKENRNIAYFKGEKAKPTPNALNRQIRKAMWLLSEFPGYKEGTCHPNLIRCGTKLHCALTDIIDMKYEHKTKTVTPDIAAMDYDPTN